MLGVLRRFEGRCIGLGILTGAVVLAIGLLYDKGPSVTGYIAAVSCSAAALISGALGGFPPWRDEQHAEWLGGLILAAGGVVLVVVAVLARAALAE